MKRILFLTQGDIQDPSSRYRVYQFLPALEKAGYEAVVHPAVSGVEFHRTFVIPSWRSTLRRTLKTFARRVQDLHQLQDFDYVFVQKTILPAPLFNMELRIARAAKFIFDFDEAIFMKDSHEIFPSNLWPQSHHIASACRCAYRVSVGNHYLAQFVQDNQVEPIVLPTAIDVEAFHASSQLTKHAHKIPVIGWAGNSVTQADLEQIISPLIDLHSKTPFVFRIIGGVSSAIPVRFPIEWRAWNLQTEIRDIANLDYGLAPLKETARDQGRCGLKILQYWAAGVPIVASSTGVYKEMIQDGENGLLASDKAEWSEKLLALIKNPDLRQKMIQGGHRTVRKKYSLQAITPKFLSLFEE